ncbi:MAG: BON domain-containing protein [Bryobacteraceae bacterium]
MRTISVFLTMILMAATLFGAAKELSDDEIYDQVRLKLAGDRDVGGGAITVKVTQGAVELSGMVKTDSIRTKAEKLTKKVKGVKSVVNHLKVATANAS